VPQYTVPSRHVGDFAENMNDSLHVAIHDHDSKKEKENSGTLGVIIRSRSDVNVNRFEPVLA